MKRILFLVIIGISSIGLEQTLGSSLCVFQADDDLKKNEIRAYIYNEGVANEVLTKSVGNLLTNHYFKVVTDIDQANVWVKLKCTVETGAVIRGEMYNFKEYYTSVEIQLENAKTSQLLFDYTNFKHRSLSPVSTPESSAYSIAIREMMRKVEKDLKKKFEVELADINQSILKSNSFGISKNMAAVKSAISLNDSYYTHINKTRLTDQEQYYLKVDKITCNSLVFQGQNFVKGIIVFKNEKGRLESVLYISDHEVYEYLVSYDNKGKYIDCMEIGYVMENVDKKMSAIIEGDQITLISTHNPNTVYHLSPQLRFLK